MLVKIVTLYVKESEVKAFIEAAKENRRNSLQEKGIASFDLLQCRDDSSKFVLYEVYSSQQAMDDHLKTAHFKTWNETIGPYLAKPTDRAVYIPAAEDI
ncbi:putative quinol monooxygenase [Desulfosporosinus sp. PR]|uniref:putative quinol monooxygenase n=1 Tax=Candidatus Desulfosporosinus nitrosoreducens TaxID=3401928 RepID=UPI0027F66D97|nr:putative quinol monooxygenase [Desulfosporosinus sp. PR]MDQ7095719.1 putative quinol monooxygenase [Desulfosporosinus sp. PR]